MRPTPPRAARLLSTAAAAAVVFCALAATGAEPARSAPSQQSEPTATPVLGAGVCTVTASQTADVARVERGQTVGLTLSIAADCPVQAEGRSDIMLVVDTSASMADEGKHDAAKAAVAQFVGEVDFARHRVGLVLFNVDAFVAQTLTTEARLVTGAFEAAGRPTGGTDIAGAIRAADGELSLAGRTEAVGVIVLMTDGQSEEPQMLAAAKEAKDRGTVLFTIGLGGDAVQESLRRVASSPAYFYYAPDAAGLADVYSSIAAMIRAFVVTDVWLHDRLDPSSDYEPGTGRPHEPSRGDTLAWRLPFVVGAPSTLSYRVRVDRSGTWSPSAQAWADFADGDGVRRRVWIDTAEVEVYEPVIHTVHLPVAWRNTCIPTKQWADIVLALDVSSSMSEGDKLTRAKDAAKLFVQLLERPGNQAAVVAYDEIARLVEPLTVDLTALQTAIDGLTAGSGTRLDRGVRAAVDELQGPRRIPENRPVIVLLSDGRQVESRSSALSEAERARALGIDVFTIALGADSDRELLSEMAGHSARAYYAPGPDDLAAIYHQVAGAVRCK